jgi:uncharacterized oxidoreductase
MPRVDAYQLESATTEIFQAVGAPKEDARITARIIVDSNLTGHESHGIMAVPRYVEQVKQGSIVPGAETEVVLDRPAIALIDGHRNFGHAVAYRATELAIEKAKKVGIAAVGAKNVHHIGRVGTYPEMIARAGLGGIVCANSGGPSHGVAPFGGARGRTGTNPIAIGFPSDFEGPVVIDMATSVHANGKIRAYQRAGVPFPDDWLLDSEGNPTTDPREVRQGGSVRTFGGPVGYKGYGLSFMVEIMSGMLTRNGYSRDMGQDTTRADVSNGHFIIAIDCEAFMPLETLKEEISDMTGWIKSSPPAEGFDEVLYPGELEARSRKERLANGVPLDGATYEELVQLTKEHDTATRLLPLD